MNNTNRTAPAPESATTCPDWCTDDPGLASHDFDDEGDRLHKGPLFGGVLRGWAMESKTRPWQFSVDVERDLGDFATVAQLRTLASAAEEAGAWLEGRSAVLEAMTTTLGLAAVAYNMAGAVAATGIGETTLKAAQRSGALVGHYVGTKLVFRAVDLDEWIQSLPTERPER